MPLSKLIILLAPIAGFSFETTKNNITMKDLNECLDTLATLNNLGKINDKFYIGQYGTIFLRTKFGYKIASILDDGYPDGNLDKFKIK